MELRQLRYFIGVAERLNFTQASRALRVAQPALSRQIRQLEEELGVALLERHAKGVRLTDAGSTFLVEARRLLEQSEQAVRAAQGSCRAGTQRLNLGYVWGLFHSLVPATVATFRQAHPEVAVNLFDYTAIEQAQALLEGRLDAGFIGFADEAEAVGLAKVKVGETTFQAVLPEAHPAARQSRIPLKSLSKDFFFVISDGTYPSAARSVREACERAGFRPRVLQAAERGHTILGLVAGNCGVALLPEALRALPHPGVVFRPLTEPVTGGLFLAWAPGRSSVCREAFVELFTGLA